MDFPALKDAGSFRRCSYCKSKVACMAKGKCMLKKEAREFSSNLNENDNLLGRLIELNRKLEFATKRTTLVHTDRKQLPDNLGKATKPTTPSSPTPKPTAYAQKLLDKKKLEEAKSKGRKRDRPKKADPNYGTKKGDAAAKKRAVEQKQKSAVQGTNPALKTQGQKELNQKPSTAKKKNPRHSRVTGRVGGFKKGGKAGKVNPSQRVELPELDPRRRASDLPEHAKKELARKVRNKLSNQGINRGLRRTELMISQMSIGKLLKVLGMKAATLAKIVKK